MSEIRNVPQSLLDALVRACRQAVADLETTRPTNDPLAFDRIEHALLMTWVATHQHPDGRRWRESVTVEQKLRELVEVLPLIPVHAPTKIRELGYGTYSLLLRDMPLATEERIRDSVKDSIMRRQELLHTEPVLAQLLRMRMLGDDAFPNGLRPPPPDWPEDVLAIDDGATRAEAAYEDLHLHGWATAEQHFRDARTTSLAGARRMQDARIAFAECAVGPTAVSDIKSSWRTHLLYQIGPKVAEQELGPSTLWSDSADFSYANDIATKYVSKDDWESARRVTEQMLAWDGPIDVDVRSSFEYKLRRIAKKFGSDPPKTERPPKPSRPKNARPLRLTTPMAPERPARAQAVVEAAAGGDTLAADFLDALAEGNPRLCAAALDEQPSGGGLGHLWLLFELDNQWLNGQILKHPAVDEELTNWILRRPRHGKNRRPSLSGYTELFAKQRVEFAAAVLEHCDDPDLIGVALSSHVGSLSPGFALSIARRSLEWPAGLARSVTEAVTRYMGSEVPDDVAALVEAAHESAVADIQASTELRGSLVEAQEKHPVEVEAASEEQDPKELVEGLAAAPNSSVIEDLIHRWRGELPWDDLLGAIDRGELASEVVSRLAHRPTAPPALLRRAICQPRFLTSRVRDPWRWMDALLKEPLEIDEASQRARISLAGRLMLEDPRDLRERLPSEEWTRAAEETLVFKLGAMPVGFRIGPEDVDPAIIELGAQWIRDGAINPNRIIGVLPLPTACRLWVEAYPDDDKGQARNNLDEPVPVAFEEWLTEKLANPEGGIDPSVAKDVLDAVPHWEESLLSLIGYAEELQEEVEDNREEQD